jgi:Small protein A (tmRNA-binding)
MKTILWMVALMAGGLALSGCSTPETRIAKQPELFNSLTPEEQQLIREGRVGMGFTPEMVKLALGDPDRVRERVDQSGRSEVWSYIAYEGPDGVMLYRGWYHRGWGHPYYPYYMTVPGRRERSRDEVVFREGRVVSVEQER